MTPSGKKVRSFGVLLLLAAVCAFLYVHFLRPAKPPPVVTMRVPTPPPVQPAFARLSALVDAHIDSIFSPLDGQVPPIPHQELRGLRGDFADSLRTASAKAQPMHQTAIQLCDALLLATQERERASLSLADARSKPYSVALSQDKKKEEKEKREFFEFAIFRRWADNSKAHRDTVVNLYDQLRSQEREFTAGAAALKPAAQAGDMIVLQRPTVVRLRYGSATLPAGLSLRVLERTADGLIVDYAGERVTLPPQ